MKDRTHLDVEPETPTPPCGEYCPGECGWHPNDPGDPCYIDPITP